MGRTGEFGHNPAVRGVSYFRRPFMNALRSAAVALSLLAWAGDAVAQQAPDQDLMKKNLEKKLEQPFLKNATWFIDYDEAKEAAKKSGKPIFAYFTRSYSN